MGMPVTIHLVDASATMEDCEKIFDYFRSVDERFSTYKTTSEISAINRGSVKLADASDEMKEVFHLAEETKRITNGYFNIQKPDGSFDPSGLVKGWAIHNAAKRIRAAGFHNYFVDAGGDIEVGGKNEAGKAWSVGIRDPFDENYARIVKVVYLKDGQGIATSGITVRGQHIWNPHDKENKPIIGIMSVTVIGPNIYEADRFATAAFAMGTKGIAFIENLAHCEGYMIDETGVATYTSGFLDSTKEL